MPRRKPLPSEIVTGKPDPDIQPMSGGSGPPPPPPPPPPPQDEGPL